MEIRYVAYDRLGEKRGVLPRALEATWVPAFCELPTLTLTYPRNSINSAFLNDDPEVGIEILRDGEWAEPKNGRFKLQEVTFDWLEEAPTRKYKFIGIGEAMAGIYIYNGYERKTDEEGRVQFPATTPGEQLDFIWRHAMERGWRGFERVWDGAKDASQKPWVHRMSTSHDTEDSFQSILGTFVRMGIAEYEWLGRYLRITNPDGIGRDLTLGDNPIRFNASAGPTGVDASPETQTSENLATHVIVLGDDGKRWEFPTGIKVAEGRRETYLTYAGVDDEGSARILADPVIVKHSSPLMNTTRQFQMTTDTTIKPVLHYDVGDYVLVQRGTEWTRMRIISMNLLTNSRGTQGYVVLGDKIDTLLEKMYQRIQRMNSGIVNQGTKPPSDLRSLRAPSAPEGLTVTTASYLDFDGFTKGVVGMNWTHDGKDSRGMNIDLDRFDIEYRRVRAKMGPWLNLLTLGANDRATTHSPFEVYDEEGNPYAYQFRMFAWNNKGMRSPASNVAQITMLPHDVPPVPPSTPTVTTQGPVFFVEWDGKASDDTEWGTNVMFASVESSGSANGPWKVIDTIPMPRGRIAYTVNDYSPQFFRLRAVDRRNNVSEPSGVGTATPKRLVDNDIILSVIDGAKTELRNVDRAMLESGKVLSAKLKENDDAISLANNGLAVLRDTTVPKLNTDLMAATGRLSKAETAITTANSEISKTNTELGKAKVDITTANTEITASKGRLNEAETKITKAQSDLTTANTNITNLGSRVGTVENAVKTVNDVTIPELQATLGTKNGTKNSTSDPSGSGVDGDRWQKWSTLAAGGKLLATWRHNGTTWVKESIDPVYIPQIDVGSGTFGTFDGVRLKAKSVTADAIEAQSVAAAIGTFVKVDVGNLVAGSATLGDTVAQKIAAATASIQKADISNLTAGSANMTQAVIDKLVANTAAFQTVKVENITATATATLNNVVAQRIAAGTASFQTVDAKNIFVTGTASLNEVVAKRFAADTGQFLSIATNQLVAGSANIDSGVVNKLYTQVVRSRQITTDMLYVGMGTNLWPDPTFANPSTLLSANLDWKQVVNANGSTSIRYEKFPTAGRFFPLGINTGDNADKSTWIDCAAGQVYAFTADISSSASVRYRITAKVQRKDMSFAYIDHTWVTTSGVQTFQFTIPADGMRFGIHISFEGPDANTAAAINPGSNALVRLTDSSLVVNGAITTKQLKVTEDMTVALLAVHKVKANEIDTNSLVADTGFIASLRTPLLTANVIKADQLDAYAINAKHTLTGSTIQSHVGGNAGIKFNKNWLRTWDANGRQTLEINANTGSVTAVGEFRNEGDEGMAISMSSSMTSNGQRRSILNFEVGNVSGIAYDTKGSNGALMPHLLAVGASDRETYNSGTIVMNGYEQHANQSGRAALALGPYQRARLAVEHGDQGGTGLHIEGATVQLRGQLRDSDAKSSFKTGNLVSGTVKIPLNSYIEWQVTIPYPVPFGTMQIYVTPDSAYSVAATICWVTRTSFRVRCHNNDSLTIADCTVKWLGVWVE